VIRFCSHESGEKKINTPTSSGSVLTDEKESAQNEWKGGRLKQPVTKRFQGVVKGNGNGESVRSKNGAGGDSRGGRVSQV